MNYAYRIVREVLNEDAPTKVTQAKDAARYLYKNCYDPANMYRESSWALLLDGGHNIIGQYRLSEGCTATCNIDRKILAHVAITSLASAVVLSHNHPSGNCRPSAQDIKVTQDAKKALDCFGISLLDHIIVTDKDFYSFAEEKACKAPKQAKTAKSEPVDISTAEDIKMLNNTLQMAFAAPIL